MSLYHDVTPHLLFGVIGAQPGYRSDFPLVRGLRLVNCLGVPVGASRKVPFHALADSPRGGTTGVTISPCRLTAWSHGLRLPFDAEAVCLRRFS